MQPRSKSDEGRSSFTLRDIKDSLSQFKGSSQPSVHSWIQEFEDNATAVQWNSLQMFIYSKQLLKGAAKIYICIVGLIHTMLTSRVVYFTMGSAQSTRTVSRGTPQSGVPSPLL